MMKGAFAAGVGMVVLWTVLRLQATEPEPEDHPLGREYFISPSGCPTNNGTLSSPWGSVDTALERVGGGNIVTLLPGVYREGILVGTSGTQGHPTVIRSQRKWSAIIRGTPSHGVYIGDGVTNVVIDGLQVDHAGIDGIKVGSYATVRNCWVHHSARQGIAAHYTRQTLIERNLVEHNGKDARFDHGLYLSGTNDTVRCNVIRWNRTYGCQIYHDPPLSSAECSFYNNLVYGNKYALTVWSPSRQTNYVFSNTLISESYVVIAHYGTLCLSNNIMVGSKYGRVIWPLGGAEVRTDFNLTSVSSFPPHGAHDVVAEDPGFVNQAKGLFWLAGGSAARWTATRGTVPPVDFFGRPGTRTLDAGAFQYDRRFLSEQRSLDPSPALPDYWSTELLTAP